MVGIKGGSAVDFWAESLRRERAGVSDPVDLRNFLRVDERITTSGKLERGDPARLAAIGVRHVINLALADHPEALQDEASEMSRAGLSYTHIPIPFDVPTEAHYRAFVQAIEGNEFPVHIHCIMNWRVSALLYRYRREVLKIDEAEARKCLTRIWNPEQHHHKDACLWAKLIGL